MDAVDWVRRQGGIARALDVRRAGAGQRAIAAAVALGELQRPRRGWLATREADIQLVAAARAGVVLSCVTQAKRLGLWVLHEDRPHVGAQPHAGTVRIESEPDAGTRKAVVHWMVPPLHRDPRRLVDPIENVLALVAACQSYEAALVIWESALQRNLVERRTLERLPLAGQARELLRVAMPFSDSGLETLVASRLAWLRVRIVPQARILGRRVDFLIGDRLVFQLDGGTHVGRQREDDVMHDALLTLAGYHVIRAGYRQVVDDWPSLQDVIMRAVAQGLHLAG